MQRALFLPAEGSGKISADFNRNRTGSYYHHIKDQLYIENKQYNSIGLPPLIDNVYVFLLFLFQKLSCSFVRFPSSLRILSC